MNDKQRCGTCAYWDQENKRNCSNPDTPLYYAVCNFHLNWIDIPNCVSLDEMIELGGDGCPCFVPK